MAEAPSLERPGLGTMIEPNKHTIDQWQGLIPNPPGLRMTPVRQNASAKVIGVRETTDCILIGSKPASAEPYIVVSEQKDVSSELRHCPVASVGEALPSFP